MNRAQRRGLPKRKHCAVKYLVDAGVWGPRDEAIQTARYGKRWTDTHEVCCGTRAPKPGPPRG